MFWSGSPYVSLDEQYIGDIRQRVDLFKDHLQQEDTLSRRFTSLAAPPPP
ncbi:unnamed protein product [Prorocentrum cordatum]|uniref:Uncharacterized protein n=1 Tax=Prorocentrum cordatum TaxID=2364126 RepID=A0ABN9X1Q5_9DINO|nr:unnamed protein product [Polarella glacialis]